MKTEKKTTNLEGKVEGKVSYYYRQKYQLWYRGRGYQLWHGAPLGSTVLYALDLYKTYKEGNLHLEPRRDFLKRTAIYMAADEGKSILWYLWYPIIRDNLKEGLEIIGDYLEIMRVVFEYLLELQ